MDSRAMSAVASAASSPIEMLPEVRLLALVRRWHEGWQRYHEARYRYLGQILDCAAIPCCELPVLRMIQTPPGPREQQ